MKKFENKIQVTKAFLPPMDEYINEIKSIWETNWLTNNGIIHNELEKQLKKYLKVKNISLFTNGHSAMEIAIKALELKGEVVINIPLYNDFDIKMPKRLSSSNSLTIFSLGVFLQ